ncbi:hypothetical protein OG21DRAFT_1491886 [Imleria badia]|nr:hypothetical protein OG21DRAFT_1491886 [Imleria badia]
MLVVSKTSVFGFTYNDKEGARITLIQKDVWKEYVKLYLNAVLFKTKDFIHYGLVKALIPNRSRGAHAASPYQSQTII